LPGVPIEQGRDERIAGIVLARYAQPPGDRLASEVTVDLHDPEFAIGRAVRTPEVGRDHADQVAGVVDQGRGLDPPES
jgi:hypothetical protein